MSPAFNQSGTQVVIEEGFPSASLAYNRAIDEARNDLIVFVHQDVHLPVSWHADFQRALSYLEQWNIAWGVLGCFGSRKGAEGGLGRVYTTGRGVHGTFLTEPEPVETLDEIILIIRRSSGLRFDPTLPNFHLYGTDICTLARSRGLTNYAFQGYCIHNTKPYVRLPHEFYVCHRHIRRKWRAFLPIYASCAEISLLSPHMQVRRARERLEAMLRSKATKFNAGTRMEDPRLVLDASGEFDVADRSRIDDGA